ncbi:hypothetical protein WH52_06490 [Tenacibaculum holothuriorum]|uniref:Uncharacterized protein n=1 Tax=Tenacibaculum holothuriorum TaxID=1635173 RepID=A0A1Y2PD45_9FLAO|nr:hypothetical protein [Tenacibaculum holothuriorum]OSY88404.1 hypothetical protein WH52_06490 [Tenacibaculum holothuriorum]
MRFFLSVFFYVFVATTWCHSQSFDSLIQEISTGLQTVETSKSSFAQSLIVQEVPVVEVSVKEISKKGKETIKKYQFNFADIDANTVHYKTSKDAIKVIVNTKKNQKLLKETVNSEKVSYQKQFNLIAKDISNARELVSSIKKIIKVSDKITESKLSLTSYDDRLDWLIKNVKNVTSPKAKFVQNLAENKEHPASVIFTKTVENKKGSIQKKYAFNLSKINSNSIEFKTKGSNLVVSFYTKRKLKMIKVSENGTQKNYSNLLDIECNSIEEARQIQRVLQDIVPLAEKEFEVSIPKIKSLVEGIEILNKKSLKINTDKTEISQKITGDCLIDFTQVLTTEKKKTDYEYQFNFKDINKQSIDIAISGRKVFVPFKTKAKSNFIKQLKDGELNYVNKISLACNSVGDAIICKSVLQQMVDFCKDEPIKTLLTFNSLIAEIKEVDYGNVSYNQKLEKLDDGIVKLTVLKRTSKKEEENIQEFKLSDIDPNSIKMKVSSKKVLVDFSTNYQEKIIKTYKDGQIKNYTNKVSVYCNSIENARKITTILKELTKDN